MELTEREYNALLQAVQSTNTGLAALTGTVNELNVKLAERYLTRQEDTQSDNDLRDQIYAYVREQVKTLRDEVTDSRIAMWKAINEKFDGLGGQITILQWAVGVEGSLIVALIAALTIRLATGH